MAAKHILGILASAVAILAAIIGLAIFIVDLRIDNYAQGKLDEMITEAKNQIDDHVEVIKPSIKQQIVDSVYGDIKDKRTEALESIEDKGTFYTDQLGDQKEHCTDQIDKAEQSLDKWLAEKKETIKTGLGKELTNTFTDAKSKFSSVVRQIVDKLEEELDSRTTSKIDELLEMLAKYQPNIHSRPVSIKEKTLENSFPGKSYYVIGGQSTTESELETRVENYKRTLGREAFESRFPDASIFFEKGKSKYFFVVGAGRTLEEARVIRKKAISSGLDKQTYISQGGLR